MPLRERNVLLVAAGYAPVFLAAERWTTRRSRPRARPSIWCSRARALSGAGDRPALDPDRGQQRGRAAARGRTPALLQPPVNVLRLSLHPDGLAPRIANLAEWRAHLLARLRRQIEVTADPCWSSCWTSFAAIRRRWQRPTQPGRRLCRRRRTVPARDRERRVDVLQHDDDVRTPVDITLSELPGAFFPAADAETAQMLQGRARPRR